jgi:uncharacterized protein YcfJ
MHRGIRRDPNYIPRVLAGSLSGGLAGTALWTGVGYKIGEDKGAVIGGLLGGGSGVVTGELLAIKAMDKKYRADKRFYSAIEATRCFGEINTPGYYFYSDSEGNVSIYDKEFGEIIEVDNEFAEENNKSSGSDKAKITAAGVGGASVGYKLSKLGAAVKPVCGMLESGDFRRKFKLNPRYAVERHLAINPKIGKRVIKGGLAGAVVGGLGSGAIAYKKLKNRRRV